MPKYRPSKGDTREEKYHCPTLGCLYAVGSERHFSDKKFLNQHIAKVHAEKKYSCSKCQKGFGHDWYRKHHEETCGQEWLCDCGVKYMSRESLLTHARRTQHQLPDHILHLGRKRTPSINVELKQDSPMIVIVQPIIQNVTCIQPVKSIDSYLIGPRPILPKVPQPVLLSLPLSPYITPKESIMTNAKAASHSQVPNNLVFMPSQSSPENKSLSQKGTPKFPKQKKVLEENFSNRNANKFSKAAAETQTCNSLKTLHSRASQCSGRAPKSKRIESTHTQTAESAVVKIKKKSLNNKSKRKSVAITTESNMLTYKNTDLKQSFWPGIRDCIFQPNISSVSACSTSTQTSAVRNKVFCDSETLTDNNFFKLNWSDVAKQVKDVENDSSFEMLSDIVAEDSLTLPNVLEASTLPELGSEISTDSIINNTFEAKNKKLKSNVAVCEGTALENHLEPETCSMFPDAFNPDAKSIPAATTDKITPPIFSDIHTQTIASSILDYNLLANMETQTTDDFSFSDLEFSDTETQTPWDDFPNIEDSSPLPADQLSIEIQTDFSSFDDNVNQDPYEFLNGMDMQNIIGECSTKEPVGINTETQTYDRLRFPQFTNSESQTLDISQFIFQ